MCIVQRRFGKVAGRSPPQKDQSRWPVARGSTLRPSGVKCYESQGGDRMMLDHRLQLSTRRFGICEQLSV